MKLTIRHQISIALPENAGRAVMHLLLTPRAGPTQAVGEWKIELPESAGSGGFIDAFGNRATLVTHAKPPAAWTLTASGTVETEDRHGVLGRVPGEPVPRLFLRQTAATHPNAELVAAFEEAAGGRDRIALLHGLMARTPIVLRQAQRTQGQASKAQSQTQMQTGAATAAQTRAMAVRVGAPDLAHAFIGAARALGIPARYVTGYLAKDSATTPSMHAWAEAYDEGLGWIGFDCVLQLCPTDRHVRVACGLDANSAASLRSAPTVATPTARLSIEISGPASPGKAASPGSSPPTARSK